MNEKVEAMIGNRDGKFVERFIPALISAGVAVVGMAVLFWSDTRANDRETATAIGQLKVELAQAQQRFDKETGDLRRAAEADRQKTNELVADVKVILAIMGRIEQKVDTR